MKRTVWALLLAVALVATAIPAGAQFIPPENHYKVYETAGPSITVPIGLRDQFGIYTVQDMVLEKFANPADKNGEGIFDPVIHQTWWRLFIPTPVRWVTATDQFGTNQWTVANAAYLLVPALKNQLPDDPIPGWNHYLCYDALGPFPGVEVTLVDQFGTSIAMVLEGKYFCNPVEKTVDGQVYEILDPLAHLTCYQIDDPTVYPFEVNATDQFGYWLLNIGPSWCLCAPASKDEVVRTEESTWGKIKALYGHNN